MCHVYRKKHAILTPHSWALLGERAQLLSENPSRVAFTLRNTLPADVVKNRASSYKKWIWKSSTW